MRVGVISDTHGLLRPEALTALAGVDHILHAGDVGNPSILLQMKQIAPVTAIRGNIDIRGECALLPPTEMVGLGGALFYLVHSVHDLDISPVAAGVSVVVSGHSHKPGIETRQGVLYLNPGSAGPTRFQLPVTVALLDWPNGQAPSAFEPVGQFLADANKRLSPQHKGSTVEIVRLL